MNPARSVIFWTEFRIRLIVFAISASLRLLRRSGGFFPTLAVRDEWKEAQLFPRRDFMLNMSDGVASGEKQTENAERYARRKSPPAAPVSPDLARHARADQRDGQNARYAETPAHRTPPSTVAVDRSPAWNFYVPMLLSQIPLKEQSQLTS